MPSWSDRSVEDVVVILPSGKSALWHEYSQLAQPSGVAFRYRLAPIIDTPSFANTESENWADVFNQKSGMLGVQSIATYQTVDAQNQIEDRLTVTVQSDSGLSTTQIDLPQATLQPGLPPGSLNTFDDAVEAARERLNAAETG